MGPILIRSLAVNWMNPLLFPYIATILILVPVGLASLLSPSFLYREAASRKAKFGARPQGSCGRPSWRVPSSGSFGRSCSAPCFLQAVYKTLWLLVYVDPRITRAP